MGHVQNPPDQNPPSQTREPLTERALRVKSNSDSEN